MRQGQTRQCDRDRKRWRETGKDGDRRRESETGIDRGRDRDRRDSRD